MRVVVKSSVTFVVLATAGLITGILTLALTTTYFKPGAGDFSYILAFHSVKLTVYVDHPIAAAMASIERAPLLGIIGILSILSLLSALCLGFIGKTKISYFLAAISPFVWAIVCGGQPAGPGNERLFRAVKSGNVQEVGRSLAAGADVNSKTDWGPNLGATPLFWAAVSGSREIAELLIARGAALNDSDRSGFTPLHVAAYNSRKDVAELLVARGAAVNAKSVDGWTPLHKAMERLVDPSLTQPVSPSDKAAAFGIVEALLANGADVNAKHNSGTTPLHLAAGVQQKAFAELLIAKHADINAKNEEGVTPLYMAAKFDRPELAELLISHGAELNTKSVPGYTPLNIAVTEGQQQVAKVLLDHGADVNARDAKGRSPLISALQILLQAYILTSSSPMALQKQKSMSAAVMQQERELLLPAKEKHRELAILLVAHGADVNAEAGGDAPLFLAAVVGDKGLVEALISKGADINGPKHALETPLHAAIGEKQRDVVELLIKKGANVNALNMSGRTPLHFLANYMDDRELAELMVKHGADVNARDKNGQTPLNFAIKVGNPQTAEVLRRNGGQ